MKYILKLLFGSFKGELAKFAVPGVIVTLSKKNIKILVNALCRSCCSNPTAEFELVTFLNRCMILANFINKNPKTEFETLKTIESFVKQNNCKQGMTP